MGGTVAAHVQVGERVVVGEMLQERRGAAEEEQTRGAAEEKQTRGAAEEQQIRGAAEEQQTRGADVDVRCPLKTEVPKRPSSCSCPRNTSARVVLQEHHAVSRVKSSSDTAAGTSQRSLKMDGHMRACVCSVALSYWYWGVFLHEGSDSRELISAHCGVRETELKERVGAAVTLLDAHI